MMKYLLYVCNIYVFLLISQERKVIVVEASRLQRVVPISIHKVHGHITMLAVAFAFGLETGSLGKVISMPTINKIKNKKTTVMTGIPFESIAWCSISP